MKYRLIFAILLSMMINVMQGKDNKNITSENVNDKAYFPLIENGQPVSILFSGNDLKGIGIAVENLSTDFERVCGKKAIVSDSPLSERCIIVGSTSSPIISKLINDGKLDGAQLHDKNEKYVISTVFAPLPGVTEAVIIAGSDRRGTIYGVYELSEQLGVSPWYDWADVPVIKKENISLKKGIYTAGEPHVKYRGIFLND